MIMGYQEDLDAAAEAKDVAKMKEMSELISSLDQTMKKETAKNFDARPCSSTRPSTTGSSPPSTTPRPSTAHFKFMRKEGHLLGMQFDMWSRHGEHFASANYTYLELVGWRRTLARRRRIT